MTSPADPALIVSALAQALAARPHVRLDHPDEVFRCLFATGTPAAVISKYWFAVLERARVLRRERANVPATA